jgi:hypothetical protein
MVKNDKSVNQLNPMVQFTSFDVFSFGAFLILLLVLHSRKNNKKEQFRRTSPIRQAGESCNGNIYFSRMRPS